MSNRKYRQRHEKSAAKMLQERAERERIRQMSVDFNAAYADQQPVKRSERSDAANNAVDEYKARMKRYVEATTSKKQSKIANKPTTSSEGV